MDRMFAIKGRLVLVTDEDLTQQVRERSEIIKSGKEFLKRDHSVIVINLDSMVILSENDSAPVVSLLSTTVDEFIRIFKPAAVLDKSKNSELYRLAKSFGIITGAVPGRANTQGIDRLSASIFNNRVIGRQLKFSPKEDSLALTKSNQIILTNTPLWFEFGVNELTPHKLFGSLKVELKEDHQPRVSLVKVRYLDKNDQELQGPFNGLVESKAVGTFAYLTAKDDELLSLMPPKGACKVRLGFRTWSAKGKVWLEGEPEFKSLVAKAEESKQFAFHSTNQQPKSLRNLKVMGIVDEFTHECFLHEVQLTSPTPQNWRELFEKDKPDMLFVESCWFGNGNTWSGLIYGYNSNGPNQMEALVELISHCNKRGIPTVFWAKEDPVHFSRFAPTAKLFDFVFTTDANMVPEYERQFGIQAQALSFFCQPRVHNPIQSIPRNQKAAFAGSYYSDKKERCENFHTIMDALDFAGIETDIYDRCFDRGLAHFAFPTQYAGKVIGNLKPDEMWKAYKGYRYTLNLNTVKHSPTMFARRVYESLASGTPVVSNYSEGVRTQFGGIICASDERDELLDYIERLKDETTYREIAKLGAREALGRHTLADRLEQVCERIGIAVTPHLPLVNLEITASTEQEVEQAIALFEQQTYLRKRLVVNLENSNVLYPYLNRNTAEEIFRVKTEFAKPFEGIVFEHSISEPLLATELEDAAIATQYQTDSPVTSASSTEAKA